MANDKQRLIEEIFVEAAGAPPDARAAILDARCRGDQSLRDEIMSLLSVHEEATGVLDAPQPLTMGVMKHISGLLRTDDAQLPSDGRIGAYIVKRVIGSGGMGVVYLAEQERPRRIVALKVIRRGLATPSLLRRFEHEAEVLGRLQHPGIAQIYEAGVADYGFGPQPYIAMEYVDGRQLLEYAEINRMGTRQRLALVARICEAVQHAHQRGVIHRDLKPANILVQAEDTTTLSLPKADTRNLALYAGVGQPKVLDFGVARIADGRPQATTMRTSVGQLIGTLAYMSPEQFGANTSDIDTRSDVYSLGVVLFQLLTGKLPFDVANRSLPEAVRMIKDDEPSRLSTVNKTFRGDLDTIVYKALEKDRNRRYQSAAEFGADLHRFLLDEPIAAKRDSSMYLLSKRLRRYRGIMIAATMALVALFTLAVTSLKSAWEYRTIAAAEKLATDAERVAKHKANELAKQLQQELTATNIERGRLEAATGNVVLAENMIWPAYLENPKAPQPRWALWEMYTRAPCLWTRKDAGPLNATCFSSDRTRAALIRRDGSIAIHDTADGSIVKLFTGLPPTLNVACFSPDSRKLAVMHGTGVLIIDMSAPGGVSREGMETLMPTPARPISVSALAWSPNGKYVATGGNDRMIRLWKMPEREMVAAWVAHNEGITALAFSPDSMQLASGCGERSAESRVKLWFVPTGAAYDELETSENAVTALAFSPDDANLFVAYGSRSFSMYDLEARVKRVAPANFSWNVTFFDFSRDGRRVLVSGGGTPVVFFIPDLVELLRLPQHDDHVSTGKWIRGSIAVTVSYDGAMKCWDARKARGMGGIGGFSSWCFGTEYSPDGKMLAAGSGDGTIVLADAEKRTRLFTVPTGDRVRTRVVHFIENGARLIAGSADGVVRIIDTSNGTITDQFGTNPLGIEIFALALHPDGHTLAASCADRSVRIWDLRDHSLIHHITGLDYRSEGAAFSPDGKLLVVSGPSNGVNIYHTTDWSLSRSLDGSGQAWSVAFSPDGTRLAASTWNNNIDMWDTSNWERLPSMMGHRGLLSTIAFSRDGTCLASGGDDATVRVWDVSTSRCLATLETAHGEATGLSFDPTGRFLTTGCQNQMVVSWDLDVSKGCIEGNLEYQQARIKASTTKGEE